MLQVRHPDTVAIGDAVTLLQDPGRFYDYTQYQQAVDEVQAWMNCLGATGSCARTCCNVSRIVVPRKGGRPVSDS